MKITTKYNLNDRIYLKCLKLEGRVVGFYVNNVGIEYNIRYFPANKAETCYFNEDEIDLTIPDNSVGFK